MKKRVLVTRPIQQAAIDELSKHCQVEVYDVDAPMPAELLMKAMRDVDAVMPCGVRVGEETIKNASKLRVVANIGVGYDNSDVEACTRRCILVTNTPDVLTEATADLAFALLLAAARRVVEGDHFVRQEQWPYWQWNFLWGSEINGKTLGLYGFG
jgi:glyoxylate reductase